MIPGGGRSGIAVRGHGTSTTLNLGVAQQERIQKVLVGGCNFELG